MIRTDRRTLLTPGPTPVPPEIAATMAQPLPHHRTPEFKDVYGRVLAGLSHVFRTPDPVLLFTASGTGAFESAYANLLSPGDRVLVASAGNFGDFLIVRRDQPIGQLGRVLRSLDRVGNQRMAAQVHDVLARQALRAPSRRYHRKDVRVSHG